MSIERATVLTRGELPADMGEMRVSGLCVVRAGVDSLDVSGEAPWANGQEVRSVVLPVLAEIAARLLFSGLVAVDVHLAYGHGPGGRIDLSAGDIVLRDPRPWIGFGRVGEEHTDVLSARDLVLVEDLSLTQPSDAMRKLVEYLLLAVLYRRHALWHVYKLIEETRHLTGGSAALAGVSDAAMDRIGRWANEWARDQRHPPRGVPVVATAPEEVAAALRLARTIVVNLSRSHLGRQ